MIDLDVLEMDKETLDMMDALYNKIKNTIEEKLHELFDTESGHIDNCIISIFKNGTYSVDVECKFIPKIKVKSIDTRVRLTGIDLLKVITSKKDKEVKEWK